MDRWAAIRAGRAVRAPVASRKVKGMAISHQAGGRIALESKTSQLTMPGCGPRRSALHPDQVLEPPAVPELLPAGITPNG
jgi:hypothetical protein